MGLPVQVVGLDVGFVFVSVPASPNAVWLAVKTPDFIVDERRRQGVIILDQEFFGKDQGLDLIVVRFAVEITEFLFQRVVQLADKLFFVTSGFFFKASQL